MEKEDMQKLQNSVDLIAKTTAYILDNMATKTDLENFATKKDLEGLATKRDLLETESRLQDQILGITTDIKSFKEEVRQEILLGK
jgi:hypothetical protein